MLGTKKPYKGTCVTYREVYVKVFPSNFCEIDIIDSQLNSFNHDWGVSNFVHWISMVQLTCKNRITLCYKIVTCTSVVTSWYWIFLLSNTPPRNHTRNVKVSRAHQSLVIVLAQNILWSSKTLYKGLCMERIKYIVKLIVHQKMRSHFYLKKLGVQWSCLKVLFDEVSVGK